MACAIVWAEVRAHFATDESFHEALNVLGVQFDAIRPEAAAAAGRVWRESRQGTREARGRVVADFLVGVHALLQADVLLARDRGFYRRYFTRLNVINPSGR